MITQRLGAEEGDNPVEQQPVAMQDFDPTYDRCGSKSGKTQNEQMLSALPLKADISEPWATSIARRADLLSNYLSQRFINPVLPTRPGVLKVIKNVPVNSQRDKLLGIWDGRTLRR